MSQRLLSGFVVETNPGQNRTMRPEGHAGPRRTIELSIRVGSDSIAAAARGLRELAEMLEHQPREGAISIGSGGIDVGYSCSGDVDRDWTHDRYFAEVEKWRHGRDEGKANE